MIGSKPLWSKTAATTTTPSVVALPRDARELKVWVDALSYVGVGTAYTAPSVTAVNEIFTLDTNGVPTGDDFTLILAGVETSALTFDESAADVKTALVATGKAATGDITAAGGPLPTDITLTWTGVYSGLGGVPLQLGANNLTGGTNASLSLKRTTPGGRPYVYLGASQTELWGLGDPDSAPRYLYIATVAGAGNYEVSAYLHV